MDDIVEHLAAQQPSPQRQAAQQAQDNFDEDIPFLMSRSMKPQIIIIDGRESLLQSIISDGLTFSLLALSIWISQGSKLWTFTAWMMFIVFLFGKVGTRASDKHRRFANCEEAIAFLEDQK